MADVPAIFQSCFANITKSLKTEELRLRWLAAIALAKVCAHHNYSLFNRYYFQVRKTIPGVTYTFTIINFLKKDSLYNHGMYSRINSPISSTKYTTSFACFQTKSLRSFAYFSACCIFFVIIATCTVQLRK